MRRILIIDDDVLVHSAIRNVLEYQGYVVSVATDGGAGLRKLETADFDLVIVDIFMPGMDGLETVRVLHRRLPNVPIIIMSGLTFRTPSFGSVAVPDFLSMALEFGAAYALHKPFAPEALLKAIEACLPADERGSTQPGSARTAAAPSRQR